jgi:hypothetical protein
MVARLTKSVSSIDCGYAQKMAQRWVTLCFPFQYPVLSTALVVLAALVVEALLPRAQSAGPHL